MKVGFFHRDLTPSPQKDLMIASVQRVMRGVMVEQLPDIGGPLALAVLESYAAVAGDWLFLDTDVLVQQDVRHVFDDPFDLAVATRDGTLKADEVGTKFMAAMPFNKGAVFSRSPAFWQAAVAIARTYKPSQQAWMGDQRAMNDAIAAGRFLVKILPNGFNYPPRQHDEDVRDKAILHFKGPRKPWMLRSAA